MSTNVRGRAALLGGALALAAGACSGVALEIPSDPPASVRREFRVSAEATASEGPATVVAADNGDFVVAWRTAAPLVPSMAQETLRLRRFAAAGVPLGDELLVRPPSLSHIAGIRLAFDRSSGGVVVVWDQDEGVFGQRFDAVGTALTGPFAVSAGSLGDVAVADAAGNFMVVWVEPVPLPAGDSDVMGQRFSPAGVAITPPFRVNAVRSGSNLRPLIAPRPGGGFLVAWTSFPPGAGRTARVMGQFLTDAGEAAGGPLTISPDLTRRDDVTSLFPQAGSGFVVVWTTTPPDARSYSVAFRRFDASGAPLGAPATAHSFPPNVVSGGVGSGRDDFIVVWAGADAAGPQAQRYAAAGTPQEAPFAVSSTTSGEQFGPAVDVDPSGAAVVVWTKTEPGSLSGTVWARRFPR